MRNFIHKITVLLFSLALLPTLAQAQVKPAPQKPASQGDQFIRIRYADELLYIATGLDTIQELKGHVELNQDTVFLFCDSATILNSREMTAKGNFILQHGDSLTIFSDSAEYSSTTKIAELYSNVSLVKGQQKLFTERLTYNANTKIATYLTGATLTDDTTYLTSVRGYFHAETDDIFFKDSVVVVSPDFKLRSDTLQFNASTKIVSFLAPTIIEQDSARIYTEDGFYNINRKKAEFTKNPQYVKGEQRAWAEVMRYDGNLKEVTLVRDAHFVDTATVARANRIRYNEQTEVTVLEGNAFIQDNDRTITGDTVIYDGRNETYATRGRSHIVDGTQVLDADWVDYDKEKELGTAIGNVIWRDTAEQMTVVCEYAEHSKKKNYLKASGGRGGRPLLIRMIDGDSLFVTADTLVSLRPEDAEKLFGKGTVPIDSTGGLPPADSAQTDSLLAENTLARDSLPDQTLVSNDTLLNAPADTLATTPSDSITMQRPKAPSPPSDSLAWEQPLPVFPIEKDTLPGMASLDSLVMADSLSTPMLDELEALDPLYVPPPTFLGDSTSLAPAPARKKEKEEPRLILAYHDVRIFKSDLQAVCDSMAYSTVDSLFRLFTDPIIWSDTSQFTADTVRIQLANDKIDRIFLRQNSFIINSPDEIFYNQIKGKHSTAFFDSSELRRVRVVGNAESVYYALDDEDAYIGVNKTICSEMLIFFGDNEVEGIRFYNEPKATLFPMKETDHASLQMEGFHWQLEKRPQTVDDLFVAKQIEAPLPTEIQEEAAPETPAPDELPGSGKK
jgi:lipopolysaccharide export system protein LptA